MVCYLAHVDHVVMASCYAEVLQFRPADEIVLRTQSDVSPAAYPLTMTKLTQDGMGDSFHSPPVVSGTSAVDFVTLTH